MPLNNIPAVLGVSTHGAGSVALVEVVGSLFGGEGEAADGLGEDGCGFHAGM